MGSRIADLLTMYLFFLSLFKTRLNYSLFSAIFVELLLCVRSCFRGEGHIANRTNDNFCLYGIFIKMHMKINS